MYTSDSRKITAIVGLAAIFLGIPVAIAAIALEAAYVPSIVLASKVINTGPGSTTTLNFKILTGPNDAVLGGAYISIISSVVVAAGLVLLRHGKPNNIWRWCVFGPAVFNLLGQISCCAAAYIFRNKYPVAISTDEVRFVDGKYDSGGVLYTKESWACSMSTLYAEREGEWAFSACSKLVSLQDDVNITC